MFVKNAMRIRDRKTGKTYDCFVQAVDLNFDGKYRMRYNVGINGHLEWSNIHCIYDNNEFNEMYEVIEYHG